MDGMGWDGISPDRSISRSPDSDKNHTSFRFGWMRQLSEDGPLKDGEGAFFLSYFQLLKFKAMSHSSEVIHISCGPNLEQSYSTCCKISHD